MSRRLAFVDDQQAARDFASGDTVRKINYRGYFLSPYAGRVVYSNPRTGTVMVQWPWGVEQESPTNLALDTSGDISAPRSLNQWYSTWEGVNNINDPDTIKAEKKWRSSLASSIVKSFEEKTLPVWRQACRAWHQNLDEITAFKRLSSIFSEDFGSDTIRLTVSNLYRNAIYWRNNKRQYRVTKKEQETGKLKCPRCSGMNMKSRVYRQGKRVMMCDDCGFSISPKDLIWE